MPDRLTPVQQQTEIGEGLAVGCLVVGVTAVTCDDARLDDALTHALATWPWAARYPAATRRARPFLAPTLRASAGRRRSHIAQWVVAQGVFVPQLRDDAWDLAAACARIEEVTTIPARRWTALATTLVDRLGDQVWRHPPTDLDHDPGHLGLR